MLCGCPETFDAAAPHLSDGEKRRALRDRPQYDIDVGRCASERLVLQSGRIPVLQMLYRQGMIIPGHPNNKGVKPLLLGSREQVKSQMEYIYRRNYGLISQDDMLEAGVKPERADKLMRMKLKFAFGKILKTEELLDHLFFEEAEVEINNGVTIKRTWKNVFQVSYQGAGVTIDLTVIRGRKRSVRLPARFQKHQPRLFLGDPFWPGRRLGRQPPLHGECDRLSR